MAPIYDVATGLTPTQSLAAISNVVANNADWVEYCNSPMSVCRIMQPQTLLQETVLNFSSKGMSNQGIRYEQYSIPRIYALADVY